MGFDLVQEQIRLAGSAPLSLDQDDIKLSGHAIECRINAEDFECDFLPSPGPITRWQPLGHSQRVAGCYSDMTKWQFLRNQDAANRRF